MDEMVTGLGLYGDTAFNTIKAIMACPFSGCGRRNSKLNDFTLVKQPNNEVGLQHHRSWRVRRLQNNGAQTLKDFLAYYIKDLVRAKKLMWHRSNTAVINLSYYDYNSSPNGECICNFAVADLYLIYDCLRGRKNFERRYTADSVKSYIGEAYDPIRTEQEVIHMEELKRLESEFRTIKSNLENAKYSELESARTAVYEKYKAKFEEARIEYEKQVAELNKQFEM